MTRTTVTAVAAVVFLALAAAQAQSPPRPPAAAGSQDIMPALLEEVRGLRAAMEAMSSSGARVQLALGRLQLQEQRLNTAIKRLDDTRAKLGDLQRSQVEQQDQLSMFETSFKESVGGIAVHAGGGDRPNAEQMEEMKTHFKRQLERNNAEIVRLTAEEATLASDVAGEQARWSDMNQRLEELERALSRR